MTAKKTKTKTVKLDLACGQNKQEGFVGVDIAGDADIVHDLNSYPWPFEDNTVREVFCSHYVEHTPHEVFQGDGMIDGLCAFMNELHRVCRKGAKVRIVHPYCMNGRAFWDPTHRRFIHETTWYYFNAEWRKAQALDHYPITADFDVTLIDGVGVDPSVMMRDHEYQAYARQHYWNVIADLVVDLKAR